jgi:predicted RND superfamily exporter protein
MSVVALPLGNRYFFATVIATFATRRPKLVVFAFVVVTVLACLGVSRLKEEEDLLVFLPTTDRDVQLFKEVSHHFGSLRVAMVGLEAPEGQDLFQKDTIARLQNASTAMRNLHGVENVVSITRIEDVVATPAGAEMRSLVDAAPSNAAEEKALRELIMARDHIVGSLVSKDGRAALIMVFLTEGARDKDVTAAIRKTAEKELAPLKTYFGGAPFAGIDIYEEAQKDVWNLSPLALLVLLLVVVLTFRDPVGVALTVISVALATLWVLGAMGWLGDKFTVATSTLPVILFASGSSYAVHVLGRFYLVQKEKPLHEAMPEALRIVGAPLFIAAATTSAGFFSFIVTDVTPMRNFGIACGAGVLICWVISLTLVPAVVALWPRASKPHASLHRVGDWLVDLWHWSRRRRVAVIVASLLAAGMALRPMTKVSVRMEPRAFFRVGSEPWKAERFLTDKFGGATFITVAMHGDLDDPATLREIARFEDYARSLEGVSQVQSVLSYLRLTNYAMGSGRKLPATAAQSSNLYTFLQGRAGVSSLLSQDRKSALVTIRVRGEAMAVTEALERFAASELQAKPEAPSRDQIADRVAWVARGYAQKPDVPRLHNALKIVALPGDLDEGWTVRRQAVLREFLQSDDAQILADSERKKLEQLVQENPADLGPVLAGFSAESKIAVDNLKERLSDARQQVAVDRALPLAMEAAGLPTANGAANAGDRANVGDRADAEKLVRSALDDLFAELEVAPHAALSAQVAGEPVLDRGFSRSVGRNLDHSLLLSIGVVFLSLLWLFRSPRLAAVCMMPSLLTIGVIFGTMGAWGVHIDLGTSLVAGIATGAGADFAMHYMWYLRSQKADEVSRSVGPVMVVSILLVSLGFIVLALGKSPVMHLFGTLAGLSMALSAFLTCLLVPALLPKFGQGMESPAVPSKSQEGSP